MPQRKFQLVDGKSGHFTSEKTPPISTVTFLSKRGAQPQFPMESTTLAALMASQKMDRVQEIVDESAAATIMRFGGAMTYVEKEILYLKT